MYVEFLRPGLVAPGVTGAMLLVLSIAAFSRRPAPLSSWVMLACAVACFYLASNGYRRLFVTMATALIACGTALMAAPSLGIATGVPFALLTGYLVDVAIRARRNKTVDR